MMRIIMTVNIKMPRIPFTELSIYHLQKLKLNFIMNLYCNLP